ncbi:MAG: arginine--tRNA ligase [Gemmatimonadota bacterium]
MTEAPPEASPLVAALRAAAISCGAPEDFVPELARPGDESHGDLASNAALVLAARLGRPPRALAEDIAHALDVRKAAVQSVEVAGPGFLNFRLADSVLWRGLRGLLEEAARWGCSEAATPLRFNVEFVSANPTGPLHVAHGRGAVIGDVVASLLKWTGHEVTREFYVNDAGRQIRLLAESVEARYRQEKGEAADVPDGGYQGEYVRDLAARLVHEIGPPVVEGMAADRRIAEFERRAPELLRREQEADLRDFGVSMDVFREESELVGAGEVDDLLRVLDDTGRVYESEGAIWLRTSEHGDEKDRVLVKSDGESTYFLTDIAYHRDKARRGFERAIDVWGADHHGHVPRMQAALRALGLPQDFLEVLMIQLVTVLRDGTEVRMSKREGRFITLRELFAETGRDVARYFFLMRRAEVPLNFDLGLALDTSEANPVYKIKYAHARMCSVFERGGIDQESVRPTEDELARLAQPAERAVAKAVLRFPSVVASAAEARAPYQVCQYLEDTAGLVNAWYHQGNLDPSLRLLAEGPARPGRLALARAVQVTLSRGLSLLGLEAPARMIRDDE